MANHIALVMGRLRGMCLNDRIFSVRTRARHHDGTGVHAAGQGWAFCFGPSSVSETSLTCTLVPSRGVSARTRHEVQYARIHSVARARGPAGSAKEEGVQGPRRRVPSHSQIPRGETGGAGCPRAHRPGQSLQLRAASSAAHNPTASFSPLSHRHRGLDRHEPLRDQPQQLPVKERKERPAARDDSRHIARLARARAVGLRARRRALASLPVGDE